MRIKTILQANAVISICIVVLIGLVISWTGQQENKEHEEEIIADSIIKGMSELRGLTYEYSLYHEERIKEQWQIRYDSQAKLLAEISFRKAEEQVILTRMRQNLEGIEHNFIELVSAHEKQESGGTESTVYQELEDRLVARLLLQSQTIVSDAFQLAQFSNTEQEAVRQRGIQIVMFLAAFLSALYIAVAFLTIRSIVKPLENLQKSTEIIGSGNLEHRVDIRSYDEINQLSGAFNQMTGKLKERTAHLEEAIKEVESFAYSASHDLRTPLRSIDGFSLAILEDYSSKLDETGKDYLARVRASAQKMSEVIDAMLSLSRLTRREMLRESVDMSAMAKTIAERLKRMPPERKVEFVIAEGVTATGDAVMLKNVMEHLLGNAWKFTGMHPTARIEFGLEQVEGKTTYFVRDDGAGFDMAYVDKLFKPFERLHTDVEFAGMGIDLVAVQRIIHRHGGKVWAEGEVEKGATFYFTL